MASYIFQNFFQDLESMKQTFSRVKKAGVCQGKFIPPDMSQRTTRRLKEVSVQAQFRHRQLDYEQLRYTLLAFLVNTEAKLKLWTKKLAREQDVQQVLNDYTVSNKYELFTGKTKDIVKDFSISFEKTQCFGMSGV